MRRGTGLLLAAVLAAAPAAADESDFTLASIGIKGQAVFKNYTHFETTPNDDHLVIDEGILQVEWARRLGAWGTVRVVGEFRDDDFGYARGLNFQIPDTGQRRSYLDLKEATISGRQGPLEITLGKQIYAWGTADAFNPTDNINPYDYLDVLDNEKMGVWSASARLTIGCSARGTTRVMCDCGRGSGAESEKLTSRSAGPPVSSSYMQAPSENTSLRASPRSAGAV